MDEDKGECMDKNKLKYEVVYEHYKRLIKAGILKPNDKLPTENEMGEKFDVSRITIIKALNKLGNEGLVYRKQGSGTYVAELVGGEKPRKDINIISLIIPILGLGREIELIEGIENKLKKRGYLLSVSNSKEDPEEERRIIQSVRDKVKGMIIYPAKSNSNEELFYDLFMEQLPMVFIDRYPPNLPSTYVVSDNYDGGYQIGKYLIGNGHKKIALIFPDITSFTSVRDRFYGFMQAVNENNIPKENIIMFSTKDAETDEMIEGLIEGLWSCRGEQEKITAIFACNDVLAYGIMKVISKKGYSIPAEFIMAGFDDLFIKTTTVPFITIRQLHYKIGEMAAQTVLSKITEKSIIGASKVIPVKLVERIDSTDMEADWVG